MVIKKLSPLELEVLQSICESGTSTALDVHAQIEDSVHWPAYLGIPGMSIAAADVLLRVEMQVCQPPGVLRNGGRTTVDLKNSLGADSRLSLRAP
jgi:hypothetical protein